MATNGEDRPYGTDLANINLDPLYHDSVTGQGALPYGCVYLSTETQDLRMAGADLGTAQERGGGGRRSPAPASLQTPFH